jgi:hypothetical protein
MSNVSALPTTAPKHEEVKISKPNIVTAEFKILGTAPYCQQTFSQKAKNKMMDAQKAGQQARAKKVRKPRDFDSDYEAAKHISDEGWLGIPAGAFRTAMIDVMRLVGFKMTIGKISIFIEADGYDSQSGQPLVKIDGDVERNEYAARNDNGGCDIRVRPLWRKWSVALRVRYDADQLSLTDIANLLSRAGMQCGIGEGRPNSRDSNGCGWGTFEIAP